MEILKNTKNKRALFLVGLFVIVFGMAKESSAFSGRLLRFAGDGRYNGKIHFLT